MLRANEPPANDFSVTARLRIEPLERRGLLSAVTGGGDPLHITLSAANTISNVWDLEGMVTDGTLPVAGLTVQFGGVLAKYGFTAIVEADGSYSVTEQLANVQSGTATAQTQDSAGHKSNVAMDLIDVQNVAVQGGETAAKLTKASGIGANSNPTAAAIATIAGTSRYLGDGNDAVDAALNSPTGVAVDGSGNLYIADTNNNVVREVNSFTGNITTIAGNGVSGYAGNGGPATSAELNAPTGIAVDAAGDVFIAESGNNVVREVVQSTGAIITVAGDGTRGYSGDGAAATAAELNCPTSVAVNSTGTELFVADSGNNIVREVLLNLSTPVISTVAGNYALGDGYSGDGQAAVNAQLSYPMGVALAGNNFLYIADTGNNVVRAVNLNLSTPIISSAAGNYALGGGYSGDGQAATSAQLDAPMGVAVDGNGDLFIADSGNNLIREVDASSQDISTVAGSGISGYSGNGGPPASAELCYPTSVAVAGNSETGSAGSIFIADGIDNAIREVNVAANQITTVAGIGLGNYSGDRGAATAADLYDPTAVAVAEQQGTGSAGDIYVADSANNVVRQVNLSTGLITTVAGNGTWGYSGDGYAATTAELDDPMGIAVDAAGDIFIADSGNNVVREVNPSGTITTIAGNFNLGPGYSGDGLTATSAQLDDPTGLAIEGHYLFIADTGNNVIRRVDLSTGVITTVAGNYLLGSGYSGDGHAATAAQLNSPNGVAVDAEGDLFIADTGNNIVREVDPSGTITTIAGNFTLGSGDSGDGRNATAAQLYAPASVAVDAAGNIFISDAGNNVIRMVNPLGTISTFVGSHSLGPGYSGDSGPATAAQLYDPTGIAVDNAGNLFIADSANDVIRRVTPPLYWDPYQTETENAGGSGTGQPAPGPGLIRTSAWTWHQATFTRQSSPALGAPSLYTAQSALAW